MTHILRTSTEHKTASLADEGNSVYCQSSGAHNIKDTVTLKFTFFLKNIFFHKYIVFVIYYKFSKQKI